MEVSGNARATYETGAEIAALALLVPYGSKPIRRPNGIMRCRLIGKPTCRRTTKPSIGSIPTRRRAESSAGFANGSYDSLNPFTVKGDNADGHP